MRTWTKIIMYSGVTTSLPTDYILDTVRLSDNTYKVLYRFPRDPIDVQRAMFDVKTFHITDQAIDY